MSHKQKVLYQSNLIYFDDVKIVLNSMCAKGKSGLLYISDECGVGAGLLLKEGEITAAAYHVLRGKKALASINNIERARFFFDHEITELPSVYPHDLGLPDTASILKYLNINGYKKPQEVLDDLPITENRYKVLVVDDSRMVRAVVKKILLKDNYEVIESSEGVTALLTIEEKRPDIVLLDIVMPGIDGNEVLRRIRATEFGKHLPIIILTSSDSLVAEDSSASGRLPKPFKPDELLKKIKEYIFTEESSAA